ncbi:MAG: hypothetical protein ACJ8CR_36660 [Roseiflexaceae bacterium]
MSRTGIGFAGIEGAWWLPAAQPWALPQQLAGELAEIALAVFALFDSVTAMYGTPTGAACGLNRLLEYKVPAEIPRLLGTGQVLAARPDFQLRPIARPPHYQLVATEIELCPSAHGFAHAMQVGYGLEPDLVHAFARMLDGRELLIVGTSQWSEFLFEQLAFCRALAAVGAHARVLYDAPIATIAERIRHEQIWRPPIFGIDERPAVWHVDILRRIHDHGFEAFLWPDAPDWPDNVGDAVVFRFGYFDCFTADKLQQMLSWQAGGATFLNPAQFILDSKAVLAALQLPAVRQDLAAGDASILDTLDRCIPETLVIQPQIIPQLRQERPGWVVKYAGYDRGNQAWGGRSLQIGALHSPETWDRLLQIFLELPWPCVAQRVVPTARLDIAYMDERDILHWMRQGATRLRSFMLRDHGLVCGTHLTVASAAPHVSESTAAVQAPVVFQD